MPVCGNYLFFELPKKIVLNPKDGQYRFSTAADTGNDFDLSIPHMMDHTMQIKISFDHGSHLVLATNTSLL